MRFASFHAEGKDRIGVSGDGKILIDLSSALLESGNSQRGTGPRTMLELVEGGPGAWDRAREIANPHKLRVSCHHKGELITDDNTENLFYKIPEVLAFLSYYMTLLPGDIVSMGTALKKSAGGGAVQNIDLNKLGGPVSVSIDGLGTLENGVRQIRA